MPAQPNERSIGSAVRNRSNSHDNAFAATIKSLYKADAIYRLGPWNGLEDVALATLELVCCGAAGLHAPTAVFDGRFHPA